MQQQNKIPTRFLLELISLMIPLAFISSVIYNYSFFLALNIHLSEIPLSTMDIVNSGLIWIPPISFMLAIGYLSLLITKRVEQGRTEQEIIDSSPNPIKTKKQRDRPYKLITALATIFLIFFWLFGPPTINALRIYIMFIPFWFWFGDKLSDAPLIVQRRTLWLKLSIIFVPIITAGIFSFGHDNAIHSLLVQKTNTVIHLNNRKSITTTVLRTLEKGIIVKKQNSNTIVFLPWTKISSIELKYRKHMYQGLFWSFTSWRPLSPHQKANHK